MTPDTLPSAPALPDTQSARRAILAALQPGQPATPTRPAPDLTAYHAGPYARGSQGPRPDPRTLMQPFTQAARAWRAEVLPAGPADWGQVVRQALDQRGLTHVLMGQDSPLQPVLDEALGGLQLRRFDQPLQAWKHRLFAEPQVGITSTAAGVADTGSLVLWPGVGEPRSLSLVPPVHVAVLQASQLYASLPAALAALRQRGPLPTNLLLVTGPSKTADIQQVLAYGAHGPKELLIVLVDDLPAGAAP